MEREEVIKRINARGFWFHTIELLPGVFTPGMMKYLAKDRINQLEDKAGAVFRGKRTLDIGTWDGLLAFELEKRGADVVASDIQDPNRTGFNTAKEILGSQIPYHQASVYDLPKHFPKDTFDVVFCYGVIYHLRHPLLALSAIYEILKPDGILYLETEALLTYMENVDGTPNTTIDIQALANSDSPITLCYPGRYKKQSNWFVPNKTCLKGWLTTSGFELQHLFEHQPQPKVQRIVTVAKKSGQPLIEHNIV
jgi:tRNA (mo5U34)-methyltransferase